QAFLLFEEQADIDWERPWYPMQQVFPDLTVSNTSWDESARVVIRRFVDAMAFATTERIVDWTQFPRAKVNAVVENMRAGGALQSARVIEFGDGWVNAGDKWDNGLTPESVYMLHKADFLVRAH